MTVTSQVLIPAKRIEGVQTTQYTATNCRAILDTISVTNTTAGAETFSANLVSSGDSAADTNLIIKDKSLAAGESYIPPELVGRRFNPGDFLSMVASDADALTVRGEGREIT